MFFKCTVIEAETIARKAQTGKEVLACAADVVALVPHVYVCPYMNTLNVLTS